MIYRPVEFSKRKPKSQFLSYFFIAYGDYNGNRTVYEKRNGSTHIMEKYLKEHPEHTIEWLEPELED